MEKLICPKCGNTHLRVSFKIRNGRKIGLSPCGRELTGFVCLDCRRNIKRKKARERGNKYMNKYKTTAQGYLVYCYSNIKKRCMGLNPKTKHIYEGLEYPEKEEFYEWGLSNPIFNVIFEIYLHQGRPRSIAPSIDRIDPSKGYTFDNMQWLPNFKNVSKSLADRYQRYPLPSERPGFNERKLKLRLDQALK